MLLAAALLWPAGEWVQKYPAKGKVQHWHLEGPDQTQHRSILEAIERPARARLSVPLLWLYQGGAWELKPLELVHGFLFQDVHTDSG